MNFIFFIFVLPSDFQWHKTSFWSNYRGIDKILIIGFKTELFGLWFINA